MKITFKFVSFIFCVSFLVWTNTSFAQEKMLPQLQTELAGTQWDVAVDDGKNHRILRIKSVLQESGGTLVAKAEYGYINESMDPITMEVVQSGAEWKMKFTTPTNSVITASQLPDGNFAGTFTSHKGKDKKVQLTKLQVDTGPIAPIGEGDIVIGQFFKPSQLGNQPITFAPAGKNTTKFHLAENGDRQYLVGSIIDLAYDKNFTTIMMGGKPQDVRFVPFPQDKPLQAGIKWDVPTMNIPFNCGVVELNFKAISDVGPEVVISINGRDRKISTIDVHFDAPVLNSCAGAWKRTADLRFSPELNEIVGNRVITLDAKGFLISGFSWTLTDVQQAYK